MKKHVVLAAGLAVLSTSAFATKARMEALGQSTDRGSLFIQDNRNIFRNAAQINSMKNYVVTEWGANIDDDAALNQTGGTSAAPNAEGGYFREAGAFAWGLNFGSDINLNNDVRAGTVLVGGAAQTVGETAFIEPEDKLDAFFGGDAGVVEWGARLGYAHSSSKDLATAGFEKKAKQWGLGLGVIFGDLQAYTNLDLVNDSEGATFGNEKWEADMGWNLGANYTFMGYTAWLDYEKQGAEYTSCTSATACATFKPEWEKSDLQIGVGRTHEVNSGARIYTSVALNIGKEEAKTATTTNVEVKTTNMPVNIGMEADATSWLTLRGGITQNVILGQTKTTTVATGVTTGSKAYAGDSTDVNAGATLNFGKLKVDGMIGTTDVADTAAQTGVLSLDSLATRVAVHYWF